MVSTQDVLDILNPCFKVAAQYKERNLANAQITKYLFLEDAAVRISGAIPRIIIRNIGVADKHDIIARFGLDCEF